MAAAMLRDVQLHTNIIFNTLDSRILTLMRMLDQAMRAYFCQINILTTENTLPGVYVATMNSIVSSFLHAFHILC